MIALRLLVVGALVFTPALAAAAEGALFISPARGTYTIGEVFEVVVRADTDGADANAAEADIAFNPAALFVERVDTDGSVLSLWPTPPVYSNSAGTVRFSGTASGFFNAADAPLVKIMFRAKNNLPGDVHMDSGALLLNDARATNIIASMRSALYTVQPVQSTPAPDPVPVEPEPTPIETPEVKGAAIQVPSISGYDDHVSPGERIVLQGSGKPNSEVLIYLQYEDDAPRESAVLTTSAGSFTYVAPDLAEVGMYRAWAEVHDGDERYASDTVVIAARREGLAAVADTLTPMLTIALPYLLLLIVAGVSLGYLYNRRAATRASS